MKKTIGVLTLLLVTAVTCNTSAYWSSILGDKHRQIANTVLNFPTMQYYKAALTAKGYSTTSAVDTADSEPSPHRGWGFITNVNYLHGMTFSNYNIGTILHAAGDASVGSKHEPAILEDQDAHDTWEQLAESVSMPTLSYDDDILHGTFAEKTGKFFDEQIAVDQDYYDLWVASGSSPSSSAVKALISPALDNSSELGEAVLKEYFDFNELVCKSWVLADWRFDEGSGQYVYNAKGSISADLRLGSSTSADTVDPAWNTSGYKGTKALYFNKYTSRGNVTNYARSVGQWTHYEAAAVAPTGAFTIETIFKCSSLDHVSGSDPDHPYTVFRYTDTNGSPQYGLKLVYSAAGHHTIAFKMYHAGGAYTDLLFDAQSAGLTMTTNVWYYVAVIYSGGKLQLAIRNMSSGTMKWSSAVACPALVGVSANPNPAFLVGSEYTSGGPCFHGYIDRLRISTGNLSVSNRLYSSY